MKRVPNSCGRLANAKRQGLSLLEVIIATVVLAVSSLMLVRIIGNADRHAARAERRVMAQMVCQNKLDEILSGLIQLESSDAQPDLYYPDWQCSIKVSDWDSSVGSMTDRLTMVEVSAFFNPQLDLGQRESSGAQLGNQSSEADKPVYTLKRLVRRPVVLEGASQLEPGQESEASVAGGQR